MEFPIYLDNNATTPCDPRVVEAMMPYFSRFFGNAGSRNHAYGWKAEEAIDLAREQVARLIQAEPQEIIFTSGATESNNLALKGVFSHYSGTGNHIITTEVEHKAVLDPCKQIEKLGGRVTYLKVGPDGLISLEDLEKSIRPETLLIAILWANNETGVIQPMEEIARIAHNHGILLFSDATQAVGKIPVNPHKTGNDLMSFASHKIYGPKGVGALFIRKNRPKIYLTTQIEGGGQEKDLRSGTLNVPGIVGFGKACEICLAEMEGEAKRLASLRDQLESALLALDGTHLNGDPFHRLPNVSNIAFQHFEGEELLMRINKDIAASTGSACNSASLLPSHVLKAMGQSESLAQSAIRFSLGRFNREEEINFVIDKIKNTLISKYPSARLG